jgi:transcriptional regulator GlxA family with amidase domain
VFGEANLLGADYRIALVSTTGADVASSIGMRIAVDGGAAGQPDPDTFLMPGGDVCPRTPVMREPVDAARELAGRSGRVASVCSGAFVLGAAGLLDGRRVTTHWKIADRLAARHPKTRVEPDALYVRDGTVYTPAGVTAGIDLALALVEEDHGPDVSREVARSRVVYLQRAGGRSQLRSPGGGVQPTARRAIVPISRAVQNAPSGPWAMP